MLIEKQPDQFVDIFYDRLFDIDPSIIKLFKRGTSAHSIKLMKTIGQAVDMIERPNSFNYLFTQLGNRHVEYGIEHPHYRSFRKALIQTLEEIIGSQFGDELRLAWEKVYEQMVAIMECPAT